MKIEHQDTVTCPEESEIIPPALLKGLNEKIKLEKIKEIQTPLDRFISDDFRDVSFVESLKYNPKFRKHVLNLLECGKYFKHYVCPQHVNGCETERYIQLLCHSRFCNHKACVEVRRLQALKRLNSYVSFPRSAVRFWNQRKDKIIKENPILSKNSLKRLLDKEKTSYFNNYQKKFSPYGFKFEFPARLLHYTLGSSFLSFSQLNKAISKINTRMRKGDKRTNRKPYKMFYISVFDIGRSSFDKTGLYYLHWHFALIPEFNEKEISVFLKDLKEVCGKVNDKIIVNMIGFRKKKSIFSYFAKRIAGILGHKKDSYFHYNDIMTLLTYLNMLYNRKIVKIHLPDWLVYIPGTSPPEIKCHIHHEVLEFLCIVDIDLLKSLHNGRIPFKLKIQEATIGEKSEFYVVGGME